MVNMNCAPKCTPNIAIALDDIVKAPVAPVEIVLPVSESVNEVKFATNMNDGSWLELTAVKNLPGGGVLYYDAATTDVTATVTAAPYVIADYVKLYNAFDKIVINVADPVVFLGSSLVYPADANYGRLNINGALDGESVAHYSIGSPPVVGQSRRVASGSFIIFESRYELENFQLAALEAGGSFSGELLLSNILESVKT